MKITGLRYLAGVLLTILLLSACKEKNESTLVNQVETHQQIETSAELASTEISQTAIEDIRGKEKWTFTDQADNEVTVWIPVERAVVMQHHSLDILAQLGAQEQVVATEKNWRKNLGDYMTEVFPGVENLPTPGDLKEWNVEEIAALKPDVVIAASQANQDTITQLKALGIPVVVISLRGEGRQEEAQNPRLADADQAYTEGCEWAVKTLGRLTGTDEQASKIWEFCQESRNMVELAVGDIPADQRIRVFVANEGNQTYGNDKYVGVQLLRAGAINVAAEEIQGYQEYAFERLAEWNPDVILVQDRYQEVYDAIRSESKYQELKAVKEDQVLLAPYWTKPWGNPGSDSIALGELWLAAQFYPEKISSATVLDRARVFYREFYGVDFKE